MSLALVTGAAGLVGSESVRRFAAEGLEVIGLDNDMRAYFFGPGASTRPVAERLRREVPRYTHLETDIRDLAALEGLFRRVGGDLSVIVHAAAQPSHDWAASEPLTDFAVNAQGTLNLLELTRRHAPGAVFLFLSTNKVYGDTANRLPLIETATRFTLAPDHPFAARGIDESMSLDHTLHSVFGASKVAADVLVQEYGRYFGLKTACFRGGCLTGPAHAGAELHGFLAWLVRSAVEGRPYTVFGYQGKQVRDNIHAADLVEALWQVFRDPPQGEAFNIGGGMDSNCSMIEAIALIERLTGKPVAWRYSPDHRKGDHIWWISDLSKLKARCPRWRPRYGIEAIVGDLIEAAGGRIA
ncbi:MAG: NAD-dependent epimerase/dehydratase family protein [Rhodospirillales bacterium]|nr:NAD-dependent epimerase/dehydratase family protein [Rhodospirillales bacterium]